MSIDNVYYLRFIIEHPNLSSRETWFYKTNTEKSAKEICEALSMMYVGTCTGLSKFEYVPKSDLSTSDCFVLDDLIREAGSVEERAKFPDEEVYRLICRFNDDAARWEERTPDNTAQTVLADGSTTITVQGPKHKSHRRPKRTDADKARDEGNIAAYLADNPDATRDKVSEATKIAAAHVSESRAWRAHKAQKKEARHKNRARGIGAVGDED